MDWAINNPEFEYHLVNDQEMEDFIKSKIDEPLYEMFSNYPLGVMKADFWRYCILYKEGGIYTDIDT